MIVTLARAPRRPGWMDWRGLTWGPSLPLRSAWNRVRGLRLGVWERPERWHWLILAGLLLAFLAVLLLEPTAAGRGGR